MTDGGWLMYASIFVGTTLLSLVFTPLALRLALRREILDRPSGHKGHESPVPYLGGLAMVGAFSLAVLAAAIWRPPITGRGELFAILGIAFGLSLVGLVDDLRNLGPVPRVLCEVGAGIGLYYAGAGVKLFGDDVANAIFTVGWVVLITNAFNLLDNMDGLSAGVAVVAAGSFFAIAMSTDQFLVASLAAGTAGCALGFLRHNFHPARIYMGDSGALFLGFLLAYLGVKLRFDGPTNVTFLVPILVVGVALLDTTLVTVSRLGYGRSPFQGGRDHISHRLVTVGIPVRAAVALVYAAGATLGGLALVVSRVDRTSAYIVAGLVVAHGLFIGALLARVPVYGSAAARFRWMRRTSGSLTELDGAPPEAEAG